MNSKPFYQTSEFWLTVLFIVAAGAGYAFGKLNLSDALAVAGTGLAISGYAISRGLSKTGGGGTAALVLVLCGSMFLSTSCISNQTGSQLEKAYQSARALSAIAEPVFHLRCIKIATLCATAGDNECTPWVQCNAQREAVYGAIRAVHVAIVAGLSLDALKRDPEALTKLADALASLKTAYDLMVKYDIFKEVQGG